MTQSQPGIVSIASTHEPIPAHDQGDGRAVNVLAWAVDEAGTVHAVAVAADGSIRMVTSSQLVFDHAVRPTDY